MRSRDDLRHEAVQQVIRCDYGDRTLMASAKRGSKGRVELEAQSAYSMNTNTAVTPLSAVFSGMLPSVSSSKCKDPLIDDHADKQRY